MKKSLVIMAAMVMVIAMVSGAYAASVAPTVAATATIANVCSASNDGKIDFGTIDEVANATGATGTITASTIHCTAGSTYAVTAAGTNGGVNMGAGYKLVNGANSIAYSIVYNATITGQGTTSSIGGNTRPATDLNLTSSIAAGALTTQPAGTYTDTITITVAY
jgi:spore coat protein U-like protein